MELILSSQRTFIPEFNGNKKLPAAEQISVVYKAPTMAMKRRLIPHPDFKFNYDSSGNVKGGEVEVKSDSRMIIDGMLIKIVNVSYKTSDDSKPITNSAQLYEAPVEFDELAEEIATHFRSELQKKVEEKN
jgi:hypothetical protein